MRDDSIEPLDWTRPIEWTNGERLVVLDGPSPDGYMDVRAPIEYCEATREGSCFVCENNGTISSAMDVELPRLRNIQNAFYVDGEVFTVCRNITGTGGYVVTKRYPFPMMIEVVNSESRAEDAARRFLERKKHGQAVVQA